MPASNLPPWVEHTPRLPAQRPDETRAQWLRRLRLNQEARQRRRERIKHSKETPDETKDRQPSLSIFTEEQGNYLRKVASGEIEVKPARPLNPIPFYILLVFGLNLIFGFDPLDVVLLTILCIGYGVSLAVRPPTRR